MTRFAPLALILALTCAAPAARAETPLSGAEFEALVLGRTLSYGADPASPYGVERYMAGRKVIWSYLDGQCVQGSWYEDTEAGAICFVYESDPEAQCWQVFRQGAGLRAIYLNDPGSTVLYDIADGTGDLICDNFGT